MARQGERGETFRIPGQEVRGREVGGGVRHQRGVRQATCCDGAERSDLRARQHVRIPENGPRGHSFIGSWVAEMKYGF